MDEELTVHPEGSAALTTLLAAVWPPLTGVVVVEAAGAGVVPAGAVTVGVVLVTAGAVTAGDVVVTTGTVVVTAGAVVVTDGTVVVTAGAVVVDETGIVGVGLWWTSLGTTTPTATATKRAAVTPPAIATGLNRLRGPPGG